MPKVADCSFVHFVYPFAFDAQLANKHMDAFDAAICDNKPIWIQQDFPSEELMPHVARFLNPLTDGAQDTDIPTARLWKLNDALDNVYGLADRAMWTLNARSRIEIPFKFGEVGQTRFAVHLALFCSGVGFLTIQARPRSESLDAWLDFIHYFRICDGQRAVYIAGKRRIGAGQTAPFFPEPAGGSALPEGQRTIGRIIAVLLQAGRLKEAEQNWWDDVFVPGRVLPYVALYVDDMHEENLHEEEACARLIYRLRHFFRSNQEIIPGPQDLRLDHPANLEFALRQWFVFNLEGGGFVACDAPHNEFFRTTLPQDLRNEYFLLFLLALQQRFTLIALSEEVAHKWPILPEAQNTRIEDFAMIRNSLLSFTARGYFAQVMQRDHHHRCYVKWLEIFQIERLYREVRDEVQDIHDFFVLKQNKEQEEQTEQANRATARLTKVAGVIGVPGLALTACEALAVTNPHIVLPTAAAALAVGGGIVGWLNRSTKSRKSNAAQSSASPQKELI